MSIKEAGMRLRLWRTLCGIALLCMLFLILWYGAINDETHLAEEDNPFHVESVKDTRHMVYPTRAPGYVVPTRSAAEIRELRMRNGGARAHVEDNDLRMPANPFGNVSYEDDVAFHDMYQQQREDEANALQAGDLDPGTDVRGDMAGRSPPLEGVNIVAMTLYGSEYKYSMGAIKNAELVKRNFPGWTLRIYTEIPSDHPKFGLVPQTVLERLRFLGAEIQYMDPASDWVPPMMWRFLVADDESVDRFIIRDTDSRLTQRDAAAVNAWVQSGKPFNCIRDHPSHVGYAVSGGMWGGKAKDLRNILRSSWRDMMTGKRGDYLEDMNFLNGEIWPRVQRHAYCSDSVSCDQWPGAHPFPVPRYGYEHVGQVVNENELGRPIDISILKQAGENPNCTPQGYQRLGLPNVDQPHPQDNESHNGPIRTLNISDIDKPG